jgi:hypothetical protein
MRRYVFLGFGVIIHFTNKFEYLKAIVSSCSLKLRYCGEYFGDNTGKVISRAAHPMVSFSEFDDKDLPGKTITYGSYGVALSKTWAVDNALSPVNYVEKNSPVAKGLVALLRARQKHLIPSSLRLPVIQLKCFTKHVYGYNSHFKATDYYFKSENEWRFVPSSKQIGGNRISENFSTYKKNQEKYNKRIEQYPLRFSHADIVFIYVKFEFEREIIADLTSLPMEKIKLASWKEKT